MLIGVGGSVLGVDLLFQPIWQVPGVKHRPVWPDFDRVVGGLCYECCCCCLAPFAVQV